MGPTLRRLFSSAFIILFLLATFPAFALASHSWSNYHWARSSNPFTLKLGDNVSAAWDPFLATTALNNSSYGWGWSSVLNTTIVVGSTTPKRCRATTGQVEVCAATYGNNGWLGLAQIWISGSHITKGIVKLNDTYFNTPTYNTSAWRNLVMCQEVGHTLGLDHQDENFNNPPLGTCMDYTNDPASNQYPNQHDFDQLVTIYTHSDSTTTVGQSAASGPGKGKMPPGLTDSEDDEPVQLGTGQWGKLIRSTNRGRTELYELDLGGGNKILTHVIWAEPDDDAGGPHQGRRP